MAKPFSRVWLRTPGTGFIMTGLGDPIQLIGANETANYMETLGVRPILGRLFLPEEEMKTDVAVVTENFWRNRLSSDPQVIGRSVTLNGVPTTIVGVIPNQPVAWFGRDFEVATAKPFDLARCNQGATDARGQFSASRRAT